MATENASAPATGYVQPEFDVPALTEVLDGEYAGIRDLVRTNLATYSSVLEEADGLDIDAYRERVREVVVGLAATGQTGMGFPPSTARAATSGPRSPRSRRWPSAICRSW